MPLGLFAACTARRDRSVPPAGLAANDSLLTRGEALYQAEKYDSARAVWTVALRQTQGARDERGEARSLTWLSIVAGRLGDETEAQTLGEKALAIKQRLDMRGELSQSYYALGLAALGADRNEAAARLFEDALRTARAVNDVKGVARAAGVAGLAYGYLGDLRRAREGHRTEREAAHRIGETRLEANGLANEAMLDIQEGNAAPAIARLDTARSLYRRTKSLAGEQNALGQLGTAFELTGEENRAFAAFDSSLTLARGLGLKGEVADLLRLLGGVHRRLGDYRQALRYYGEADTLMRQAGLTADLGSLLRSSAEAELHLGNLPRAEAQLGEALRWHTASGEPFDRLEDLLLGAQIDYRNGGMSRAEPRLRDARSVAARVDTRGARIAVALADADLSDQARDSRRVLRVLRSAAPDMAAGDFGSDWIAHDFAARAHARLGVLDSAVSEGHQAVAAVERLRASLVSEPLRASFVADRAEVYADLVLTLLRLNRPAEAFTIADAARSRGLIEHLAGARSEASSALPRELIDGEVLLRRIDSLVQRLQETAPRRPRERGAAAAASIAMGNALSAARSEYEALLERAAQSAPRTTAVLGVRPARLEDTRAALQPDEALLEYLVTPDRLFVFAVTLRGLRVLQSELVAASLVQQVRLLRDLWGAPSGDWHDGAAAAQALYRTLIAPVRNAGVLSGTRHLLIVPHGVLGQLPFAALQDEATGHFLAQDFSVVHLPSAAALPGLRERLSSVGGPLVSGEGFAPFPQELPATASEVEALRASMRGVAILTGGRATESAVRHALAQDGLVHVATHGVLNVNNPMFSRIELARSRDPADDGRLEVHEILGMMVRSSLVFLSGCETGAGMEWTDDAVLGTGDLTLAQAVLAAGAANVIMTLWRIDDAGAAVFAGRFYRNLGRMPIADALATAQREMASDGRYASPYYWAGYTLSGAGRLAGAAQDAEAPSVPVTKGRSALANASHRSRP